MSFVPNALSFKYGFSKQSAEGAAASTVTYFVPAWSGDLGPEQTINAFEVSDANSIRPGHFKTELHWTANLQIGTFPDSLGLLTQALLGGSDTTSGTAVPYSHSIPNSNNTSTWLTFFNLLPDGSSGKYQRFEDGVVDSLQFDWASGQPVKTTLTAMGKTVTYNYSPAGTTTTHQYVNAANGTAPNNWLTSVNPTLKLDYATTPASTTRTIFESGYVKISRAITPLYTDQVTPTYMSQGLVDVEFSAQAVWDSYQAYQATFFGGTSGTATSATVVSGAMDFTFLSTQAGRTFQLQIPALNFSVPQPPLDTSAGPLRLTFAGALEKPTAGNAITAVVLNDTSTSYG